MSRGGARIRRAIAAAKMENRAALMPYLTLGYPALDKSLALVEATVAAGADIVELGVPFSDPLADGPVIQRATHAALAKGTSVAKCLQAVAALRERGIGVPLTLMGYFNPICAFGEEAFAAACAESGVDGLIVPDLPPDEASEFEARCAERGVALIYLLAPTSSTRRMRLVTARSEGFVYLVSVAGVTGERDSVSPHLAQFIGTVRELTSKPLAVGFGVSGPRQAREVASVADGVIVGSAIVRLAGEPDATGRVERFVRELRAAMDRTGVSPNGVPEHIEQPPTE